jgi:small conductance mechanosensitive channel
VPIIEIDKNDLKKIALSLAVVVVTVVVSRIARGRLRSTLERGGFQTNVAILLARLLWIGVWTAAVLLILSLNGIALTPLAAFIGVVGLAASLSLQQVLQNLVAGVYLLAERPFEVGDLICVVGANGLNHEGRVQDIQMRTTHLRSIDDELILVPNAAIFSGIVTNRTAVGGYVTELTVTWPRDVDPSSARAKVLPVLEQVPSVLSTPRPKLWVDKASKEDWVASILFWAGTHQARSEAIWAIAAAFPEASVNEGVDTA